MAEVMLYAEATFDLASARHLADAIAATPSGTDIAIDFSRVHDFRDSSAAVLSQALAGVSRRISLRGLTQHQVRLLRYLGVPGAVVGV